MQLIGAAASNLLCIGYLYFTFVCNRTMPIILRYPFDLDHLVPPRNTIKGMVCNPALTARTIVHHLMRKEVTINTEMIFANRAFVTTAYTHSLGKILSGLPLFLRRNGGKRYAAGETSSAARSTLPGYFNPVHQRK